jgi:hypothetical protein
VLNLDEALVWEKYIASLRSSHVRLEDVEDELIWSKNPTRGVYTPKVGYRDLCEGKGLGKPDW